MDTDGPLECCQYCPQTVLLYIGIDHLGAESRVTDPWYGRRYMTSDIAFLDPTVATYLAASTTPPSPLEQRLIDETQQLPHAQMQIGFPQARFMALLTRILRPTTVVEIGVFTGYSALVVAQELTADATLIACDINEKWPAIGRPFWEEAGVADRIDLRIGPAGDSLAALPADTVVDLAFIDADKTGYLGYVQQLIPLMHPRSVILVDNVLWDGQLVDPEDQRPDTVALREFNEAIVADSRLEVSLLPVGDGLSFITLAK